MSNLINNYSLTSEKELAEMLSHYSSEFVISVVDENIKQCCNNITGLPIPNAVKGWELNFKSIIEDYGEIEEVTRVREATYKEIIDRICINYNLNFTIEDVDLYAAAYNLYEFFISRLSENIINFFAVYIYNNRKELYSNLDISDAKKMKDLSGTYARQIIDNDEALVGVITNISAVVHNIMGMNVDFDTLLRTLLPNNYQLAYYLSSIVSPKDDKFFELFCNHLKDDCRPMLLTMIRFSLQRLYNGDNPNSNINLEGIVV